MKLKHRRLIAIITAFVGVIIWLVTNPESYETFFVRADNDGEDYSAIPSTEYDPNTRLAIDVLAELEVKGRAPKTGYSREAFYDGWPTVNGCSLRQRIIKREFGENAVLNGCDVVAGEYDDPYTGEHKVFASREEIANGVQIDHVVALSDAWQKGAQYLSAEIREQIATDPLNLLAVDATANIKKSDGDAATWLPSNKKFRCQYVARQISVKFKYKLWLSKAEKEAMERVLSNCPKEPTVGI